MAEIAHVGHLFQPERRFRGLKGKLTLILIPFTFLSSTLHTKDQSNASQTCQILSHQKSFDKFKFLGLTPDYRKQDPRRWGWRMRVHFLNASQLTVKINDIWELLKGYRIPALEGEDEVSQARGPAESVG